MPDYSAALSGEVKGVRIGVPKEYFISGMQPEVEAAVRAAVAHLEALGAHVREVSLPHTDYGLPIYYLIAPAEASANLARFDGVRYGPRFSDGGGMWEMYRQRAARASAARSNGASCWARTRSRRATTTPTI